MKEGKVFLAHHKKFDKWTPPGGHIEENETPDQALVREWKEELGLDIEIIPAARGAFSGDANATPIPLPFHMDLEREGFDVPHVGHFFFVQVRGQGEEFEVLKEELHDAAWFSKEDLAGLKTFDQVRALAVYAIDHYPVE